MATVAALRTADQRLRRPGSTDVHELYASVRRAVGVLAPMDAFYVGLYRNAHTLVIPYAFAHGQCEAPEVTTFGRGGLSHRMRVSRQPYRFNDDQGHLLTMGVPWKVSRRPIQDGVAVALIGHRHDDVIGLMCAEFASPGLVSDELTEALGWLGSALILALDKRQDESRPGLYTQHPELDSSFAGEALDIGHEAARRLASISAAIAELRQGASDIGLQDQLQRLQTSCDRFATEIISMQIPSPDRTPNQAALTRREFEIAELISTRSLSNAELAGLLHISEKTVKTHVTNILRKLKVRQREAIQHVLL